MKYHTNNAWIENLNTDPRKTIDVVIGDDTKTAFEPQAKFKFFDNEANFSLRLADMPIDNRTAIKVKNDVFEYGEVFKKTLKTYKKNYNNSDAYEFEWVFYDRPQSLKETLTLQVKNLEFYKQPPLNEEIIPKDGETVTATDHFDKDGNVLVHRDEDIVGSYAVYLSRGKAWNRQSPNMAMWYSLQNEYNKRDKGERPSAGFSHLDSIGKLTKEINKYEALSLPELKYNKTYETGKVFHLPKPKLIDADGKEAYVENFNIDREKALMTFDYPKEFMDSARYPVVVDPTFGSESYGGSWQFSGSGDLRAVKGTPINGNGVVDSITYEPFAYYSSTNAKPVIGNSSGDILTNGVGPIFTFPGTTVTATYSTKPNVLNGVDYAVGYVPSFNTRIRYDTGSTGDGFYDGSNSYSSPSSFGVSNSDYLYSIYATYTVSGGGSSLTQRNSTLI